MTKQRRRRGVILTKEGYNKLQQAKSDVENSENLDKGYTLEVLSSRTGLDPDTLVKIFNCQVGVDKRSLNSCFRAFNLELKANDYQFPQIHKITQNCTNSSTAGMPNIHYRENNTATLARRTISPINREYQNLKHSQSIIQNKIDWGEAPDVSNFCGRKQELTTMKNWITNDRCRVLLLLGMGGMGKTWLSVKIAEQIQDNFDFVIWRSLDRVASMKDMIAELIQLLSKHKKENAQENIEDQLSQLMSYFKSSRCLLVLDDAEKILENFSCNYDFPDHNEDYKIYHKLLKLIAETQHQSCLILSSRKKPKETKRMEGDKLPVRVLPLKGLQLKDLQQMCQVKCSLHGSDCEWEKIIKYYGGNPLVFNIVCTTIKQLFDGKISDFIKQNIFVYGEIQFLLQQYFENLSHIEKAIMCWLSFWGKSASFSDLREHISHIPPQQLLEATESLQERSLLEKDGCFFSLQPAIREHIYERSKENKIFSSTNFNGEQKQIYNLQLA